MQAAIISLPEATVIGSKLSILTLIARKADPQMELKIMRSKKLLDIILLFKKNFIFYFLE